MNIEGKLATGFAVTRRAGEPSLKLRLTGGAIKDQFRGGSRTRVPDSALLVLRTLAHPRRFERPADVVIAYERQLTASRGRAALAAAGRSVLYSVALLADVEARKLLAPYTSISVEGSHPDWPGLQKVRSEFAIQIPFLPRPCRPQQLPPQGIRIDGRLELSVSPTSDAPDPAGDVNGLLREMTEQDLGCASRFPHSALSGHRRLFFDIAQGHHGRPVRRQVRGEANVGARLPQIPRETTEPRIQLV